MKRLLKGICAALPLAVLSSPTALAAQSTEQESAWKHSIEIYALALNIRGDAEIAGLSSGVDVDPEFIMNNIDMGAMLHWETIYNNTWGFYLDYSFMKLSGKTNLVDLNLDLVTGKVEVRQGVLEAKAFKRYQYGFGSVDYMAGIRWWDNDIDASLRGKNGIIDRKNGIKEDWVDYLIGARLTSPLNENWDFYLNGDIGFSGDTDFTSSVQTGVRYHINSWSDINLAYKSTWVDYDNGDTFAYNTASQGFLIGWAAHF
ncbi:hypothetical protein JCM19236_411 [Vibrio sp. JCM 19236]|nr:hypothetical protein JCM19236_411 [Vibrio sp. JCM 19236]